MASLPKESCRDTASNPCYILSVLAGEFGEVVTELEERPEEENGYAKVRAQFEVFLSSGYSKNWRGMKA
jgi:hypothetical protein